MGVSEFSCTKFPDPCARMRFCSLHNTFAGMNEVTRILSASNHFVLLELPVQATDVKIVKKQYKRLALLVHPDKCSHEHASEAFKKLTVAFDCLSDVNQQSSYLLSLSTHRGHHQHQVICMNIRHAPSFITDAYFHPHARAH